MPTLSIKKAGDVPAPSRATKAVREQQQLYEGFIQQIGEGVGDLELGPSEGVRAVKVRLRRASTRLGQQIDIWDLNGHVYFTAQTRKRRGRPPKQR